MPPDNLSSLVVDPNLFTQDAGVIVSDAGNNSLLIFNLLKNSWWRLSITHPSKSVDHPYVDESEEISFDELAVSQVNGVLYATSSRRHELYSIDLQELRKMEDPVPLQCNVSITGIFLFLMHLEAGTVAVEYFQCYMTIA